MTEIYKIADKIYRIQHWDYRKKRECLMPKYKIINLKPEGEPELIYSGEDNTAVIEENGYRLPFTLSDDYEGGFDIRMALDPSDRLYGLGDATRGTLQHRGQKVLMQLENVHAYGPIPYLMSSRGWAIIMNCTYVHTFDVGATNPDELHIYSKQGALDFIVVCGSNMQETLYLQGKITGRPVMMPKQFYGLTVVHNEAADVHSFMYDALRYKERDIPVDTFSLEPTWMETFYDASTEKKWDYNRFPIWDWMGLHAYGANFPYNLNQMGYSLCLWTNCAYDFFWKEEGDMAKDGEANFEGAVIQDKHFTEVRRTDTITKKDEPWFEHLKKFVDNGADAFKMDGNTQVTPCPDHIWADKYTDAEIRNLYPAVYAKQMKEGYQEYTGRRGMFYSCSAYLGSQKYVATWAGDTGGGIRSNVSMLNYAMCGHSYASFDMYAGSAAAHHAGFLAPWAQHLGWANWDLPWFLNSDTRGEDSYRWYAQLRSKLFPYLYGTAHVANTTSLPVLRPLTLMYMDTDKYDKVYNEYMLGDAFLVNVWDMNVVLPEEDEWFDFYTGKKYEGPKSFVFKPEEIIYGGGLYVKAGSIVVMQDHHYSLRNYRPGKLYIHVYPGKDAEFTLYEDDYYTYAYEEKGEFATTKMELKDNVLKIYPREGTFKPFHDVHRNRVSPTGDQTMPAPADFEVIWHHADGTTATYTVPASAYATEPAVVEGK
ncbi:MAG: glycoside hydrolase family 31 protein [Clostridia bacterium]|nr:glycoside hydrolase family 31 protein [Clostridia bacterium]